MALKKHITYYHSNDLDQLNHEMNEDGTTLVLIMLFATSLNAVYFPPLHLPFPHKNKVTASV